MPLPETQGQAARLAIYGCNLTKLHSSKCFAHGERMMSLAAFCHVFRNIVYIGVLLAIYFCNIDHCTAADSKKTTVLAKPWHMATVEYGFEEIDSAITKIEVDFWLTQDIPADPKYCPMFISIAHLYVGDNLFYAGFSSHDFAVLNKGKVSRVSSPGLIFRRFGSDDSNLILADREGYSLYYDSLEGKYVDVSCTFTPKKGVYTLEASIQSPPTDAKVSQQNVYISVYSHSDKKKYIVGGLKFAGSQYKSPNRIRSFLEIIQEWKQDKLQWASPHEDTKAAFPLIEVAIGNWRFNGVRAVPATISAIYRDAVPAYGIASCASNTKPDPTVMLAKQPDTIYMRITQDKNSRSGVSTSVKSSVPAVHGAEVSMTSEQLYQKK